MMPSIEIYQGDCLELLKTFHTESIDLVFTDPPYNENYDYRGSNFVDYREDYYEFIHDIFKELFRLLKPTGSIYVKHSSKQIPHILEIFSNIFKFQNLITWISNSQAHPKNNYDSYYEPIFFGTVSDKYTFNKKAELREQPPNYWSGEGKKFVGLLTNCWYDIKKVQAGCLRKVEGGKIGKEKPHPCSMPLRLAERAIKISSNPEDIVLDPFVGSGTTCIAAYNNGRNSIGIELDDNYIKVIENRMNTEI
jgi:DNA modification methylase